MSDVRHHDCDLLIVGAGPAGLYGAYYAGFRGLRVALMDSLPEPGGQVTAMYPEKLIYDVAGFPEIKGQELIDRCRAQADQFNPTYLLEQRAETLDATDDGVRITSHTGLVVDARAVVITGGIGTFSPKPLPAAENFRGTGLLHFVPRLAALADQDVIIVGGGDSAFDWALSLEPLARSVTLVHRRDRFRAHEHTVKRVLSSTVKVLTFCEVARIGGEERVEDVDIVNVQSGERHTLPAQAIVAALGFKADLGPLQRWGLQLEKRKIAVDTRMATSVPRVFAAGDIVTYPGKVDLISVAFGEAATAVNNAATVIDPSARIFPGHSSDR